MTEARANWMARYFFLSILIHLVVVTALGLRTHEALLPREPIRVRMVEIPKPAEEIEPEEADILAPFSTRASGLSKPAEERRRLESPREALPLPRPRQGPLFSPQASARAEPLPLSSSPPESSGVRSSVMPSRPLVIPSLERAERPEAASAPRVEVEARREVPEREVAAGEERRQEVRLPTAQAQGVKAEAEAGEPQETSPGEVRGLETPPAPRSLPLAGETPLLRETSPLREEFPESGVAPELERQELSPLPRARVNERPPLEAMPSGKSLSKPEGEIPSPAKDLSLKPETLKKPGELEVPEQAGRLRPERGLLSPRAEEAPTLSARAPLKPSPDRPLSPEELKKALNLLSPQSAKEMILRSRTPREPKTSISLRGDERVEGEASLDIYSITEDIQDKVASVKGADSPGDEGRAISLDTKEWKYVSYMAHIKERIELAWSYPGDAARQGIHGKLFLKFVLKDDGSLLRIKLLRSSGHKVLDEEALSAVSEAAPFKPFPPYFGRKLLPITATFEYRISFFSAE